ncbi:antimicrobial peptide NK-lysin-like isoform X4 [Prionailurus bengalensis]|uniref:antimicrobial peptide NK-lysin-like isoform X4 n=1 Tax=Prionailurus bengalensis TaxID=37029 RepID=UPI001CA9BB4D|nr:antimicrobial peptide NK-lysin-like isoform X4 [Prionailurus bengalensis]XP_043459820.1 antimicrobial peptide NK-lysin-like isoform X4 [Prionailurus bengalensis]
MTSWALLLLASVLLATPGLTFCGLTPEDHDLDMADRCQDEPFFQMLAQETPQRDLLNKTEGLIYNCWPSWKIMSLLKKMVGEEASQETMKGAVFLVCMEVMLLRGFCMRMVSRFIRLISQASFVAKLPGKSV